VRADVLKSPRRTRAIFMRDPARRADGRSAHRKADSSCALPRRFRRSANHRTRASSGEIGGPRLHPNCRDGSRPDSPFRFSAPVAFSSWSSPVLTIAKTWQSFQLDALVRIINSSQGYNRCLDTFKDFIIRTSHYMKSIQGVETY